MYRRDLRASPEQFHGDPGLSYLDSIQRSFRYSAVSTPGHLDDLTRKVDKARLAVETGIFPLYEVENGTNYTLNWQRKDKPVSEYLLRQKRYNHLEQAAIDQFRQTVDTDWDRLLQIVQTAE